MKDNHLKDLLNAGVELFKAGEKNFKTALGKVEKNLEEIKKEGSAEVSEASTKIKSTLKHTVDDVKAASERAGANFKDVQEQAKTGYRKVVDQIYDTLGEDRLLGIKDKLEELSESLKKTAADIKSRREDSDPNEKTEDK